MSAVCAVMARFVRADFGCHTCARITGADGFVRRANASLVTTNCCLQTNDYCLLTND
jgi:hypothetical protein